MSDTNKDRIESARDKLEGNIKENIGKVAHDHQTEVEGKADKVKGDLKDAMADLKDKVADTAKHGSH